VIFYLYYFLPLQPEHQDTRARVGSGDSKSLTSPTSPTGCNLERGHRGGWDGLAANIMEHKKKSKNGKT
jgi:hypothetical protein